MGTELLQANGFLVVNKPEGITSHDVVDQVRKLFPKHKVGHGGTLDPLATGVLVLGIGQGTKQLQYFLNEDKQYCAGFRLGIETNTQDSTGDVMATKESFEVLQDDVERVCHNFKGVIEQIPPMFSAKKLKGQRLYKLARKGISVERDPKKVTIHSLYLKDFNGVDGALDIQCSKGTYVRTLCHDIGARLGVGAHMTSLVRTRSGSFALKDAYDLDILKQMSMEQLMAVVINKDEVLFQVIS